MSPRTGRPKAKNPITISMTIRLDPEMDIRLRDYCQKKNISRGKAIRDALDLFLDKKVE